MIELKAIQYYGRTDNGDTTDTATITLVIDGKEVTQTACSGSGPVDAIYSAINKAIRRLISQDKFRET